jgi:two-component system sensor histidine kinase YesM
MQSRIRQRLSRLSFRFKIMMASIICILIPACITLSMFNYLTQDAVKEQAIANSQESSLLVGNYVTNSFRYMLNIANSIQTDSEMNTIMKQKASGKVYTGPNAEYDQFTDENKIAKTIDTLTVGGEKCYVTILLKNGSYFTSYSPSDDYNPIQMTKEPWFGQLNNLYGFESYWVESEPTVFHDEKVNNPYQISVVRTLRGDSTTIYGYVIVTIMENRINHNFERLADSQEFMILDASNVILSNHDASKIGTIFPYSNQATNQITSDIIQVGNGNESYLMTQQSLSFTGWKLVSLTPYKTAIFKINAIFNKVFVFQLFFFFVFLLLLLYVLRTFTKPLVRLGRVAITVQRGNLEVRSHIRGQDEIGRLGYLFDQMLDRIKEMIAEISLTQTRKRRAELAMLQAQINPHFLFNVLNSIRMKVLHRGDKESAVMIGSLSKLLRMTISQEKSTISLHEEVEVVIDYMQLMNMRQKEKAQLEVEVSTDASLEKVPRFFLQPLIENALIHGLNQSAGMIILQAWKVETQLIVTIADNGIGMNAETLDRLRNKLLTHDEQQMESESRLGFSSMGISNVNERMRMTYGESFVMQIDSEQGKGTRISMFIPRLEVTQTDV